jgi:hypothetical protein
MPDRTEALASMWVKEAARLPNFGPRTFTDRDPSKAIISRTLKAKEINVLRHFVDAWLPAAARRLVHSRPCLNVFPVIWGSIIEDAPLRPHYREILKCDRPRAAKT